MFCFKCGEQIDDKSKYCPKCGTCQDGSHSNPEKNLLTVNNDVINSAIADCKDSILGFASNEPFAIFNKSENVITSGIIFSVFIGLFAYVVNTNYIQILNELIGYFTSEIKARYGTYIELPNMQIELTYELLGKFIMLGVICVVLDLVISIIILTLRKKEYSIKLLLNNIAISYMPFIIGLVANIIVANFNITTILGFYGTCIIVHLIFLYKAIESMLEENNTPIWEYSFFILIVSIIISVILFNAINDGIGIIFDTFEAYISSLTNDLLDLFR